MCITSHSEFSKTIIPGANGKNYLYPGVYIEEMSSISNYIAEKVSNIPVFIGYTQIATRTDEGDLFLVPTKISSLNEFELYFGHADTLKNIMVEITDENDLNGILTNRTINILKTSSNPEFLLYYSLSMYFNNGGGDCYIVSVANRVEK